jgi:hypothetical protein
MTIPSDVKSQIQARFPEAQISLAEIDPEHPDIENGYAELAVNYHDDQMVQTVANTEEGWARAVKHALAWLSSVADEQKE